MRSERVADAGSEQISPAASLEPGATALDDVERALLAQLHFATGDWQEGLAVALASERSLRGLALIEARARFGLGEQQAALTILASLLARDPGAVLARYHEAQFLSQAGRAREAVSSLRHLLQRMPDFPGALQLMAQLVFPGPPYREVLRRLHAGLRPRTYLEIGVEHGTSLALAVHSQQRVGIDPVPRAPTRELPPGTRLFQSTSDAFFLAHRREDVFGDQVVDLAFIDGMHWFEYALRDFHNVERWCGPRSTIVLHDCLPAAGIAASRERRTSFWVGDTWKALEYLLSERSDLSLSIVPCHPSGLIVVRKLDPGRITPSEALAAASARYLPLEYPYEPGAWPSHYPIVPNTDAQLARLLDSMTGVGPE
jgi:Methyltransferase domain/Tetratricopeptide repeat